MFIVSTFLFGAAAFLFMFLTLGVLHDLVRTKHTPVWGITGASLAFAYMNVYLFVW